RVRRYAATDIICARRLCSSPPGERESTRESRLHGKPTLFWINRSDAPVSCAAVGEHPRARAYGVSAPVDGARPSDPRMAGRPGVEGGALRGRAQGWTG